jgi:hypothetical protein
MKNKSGTLAVGFVTVVELVALAVTSSQTFNLIELTLPPGAWQVLGYVALVALGGGLIGWTAVYMYGAKGTAQCTIAIVMIVTCFIGETVNLMAGMLIQSSRRGQTGRIDDWVFIAAIVITAIVLMGTIGSVIGFHISNPRFKREQAEQEAQAAIEEAALDHIKRNLPTLAAQLAPHMAQAWMENMIARQMGALHLTSELPTVTPPKMKRSSNSSNALPTQGNTIITTTPPPAADGGSPGVTNFPTRGKV